jgi:BirA family biotin operon repressor/biotin-[acetyl-CoA-carboxylase] ligase
MQINYLNDYNGFHLYVVDEIPSTNTYFKEKQLEYSDKSILIAKKQTNGRGRYQRIWESNDDIIFSLLFKNNNLYQIITPLSIISALKDFNINSKIKWPNDIYLDNKKLCGILIEDTYSNNFLSSVVGIGINKYDKDNVNGIGYYKYNNQITNMSLINKILDKFNYYLNLDKDILMKEYKDNNIVIGKDIIYLNKEYKCIDITEDGYLVVKNDNEILNIKSNEIDIKNAIKK